MKTKYIIAAAVGVTLLVVVVRKARASSPPACGAGARWVQASDTLRTMYANKTGAVADQVNRWGGFCAKTGNVSEPYAGGAVDDDNGADEPDSYLITSPRDPRLG